VLIGGSRPPDGAAIVEVGSTRDVDYSENRLARAVAGGTPGVTTTVPR
jgi:hypothetical protein